MNIILFAGGAGTRLWPLSRVKSPKQFAPIFEGKSTLQLAWERIAPFGKDHIFVATGKQYSSVVHEQLEPLGWKSGNIILEPERRDLAAAVLLSLLNLKEKGISGPVAIIWSDHIMSHPDRFREALITASEHVKKSPSQFVFLAETARFANANLGWINIGEKVDGIFCSFSGWKYRPQEGECVKMFESGKWQWNPGYFVFDIDFCIELYKKHEPDLFALLSESMNEDGFAEVYARAPQKHFDSAIAERLDNNQAVVLPVDLGWSDPGTLYALKEAFVGSGEENLIHGTVVNLETKDSLLYNDVSGGVLATIGLSGMVVVRTEDSVLVCPKDRVGDIKTLLGKIKEDGLERFL